MKLRNIIWCTLALLMFVSCKEEDDEIVEFENWQTVNDNYFKKLVEDAKAKSQISSSWALYPCYSRPETGFDLSYSDYIVVEKLEVGKETTSPLLSDSIAVHYVGSLLPSASYPYGFEFDRTFIGTYDPVVASPSKLSMSGVVKGFTTALLHMHRGDHWRIYIPYQLGYNSYDNGTIPPYSTMIFDLRLEDYWSEVPGDRDTF